MVLPSLIKKGVAKNYPFKISKNKTIMKKIIRQKLENLSDINYKNFSAMLTPSVKPEKILGVRVPILRKIAKEFANNSAIDGFLNDLPHFYLEENSLHGYIIEHFTNFEKAMHYTQEFLPYIDNWATCDTFCPKVFKKQPERLLPYIDEWLKSSNIYTVRFAINMLMRFFLDKRFDLKYAERISKIRTDEYYLNMVIAWYFATALAKQYENILPFIENKKLSVFTHNKTIQKAVESYRISKDKKQYLKTLKIKQ